MANPCQTFSLALANVAIPVNYFVDYHEKQLIDIRESSDR